MYSGGVTTFVCKFGVLANLTDWLLCDWSKQID